MKIKTSKLIGSALDWAVAVCKGKADDCEVHAGNVWYGRITSGFVQYRPSTKWEQSGPIIEREGINLSVDYQDSALSNDMVQIGWKANLWNNSVPGTPGFLQWAYGSTPHIAAMRCYVASKLGDEVDVPEELV